MAGFAGLCGRTGVSDFHTMASYSSILRRGVVCASDACVRAVRQTIYIYVFSVGLRNVSNMLNWVSLARKCSPRRSATAKQRQAGKEARRREIFVIRPHVIMRIPRIISPSSGALRCDALVVSIVITELFDIFFTHSVRSPTQYYIGAAYKYTVRTACVPMCVLDEGAPQSEAA